MPAHQSVTSVEDLLWLYKMAIEFQLESEKKWLKEEIESVLQGESPSSDHWNKTAEGRF